VLNDVLFDLEALIVCICLFNEFNSYYLETVLLFKTHEWSVVCLIPVWFHIKTASVSAHLASWILDICHITWL